jgi:uncharacterized membrane protein HdeD (DUF308 family)
MCGLVISKIKTLFLPFNQYPDSMKTPARIFWFTCFIAGGFILSSCAAGNDRFDADPAGFWAGLWHGFISLITFIISLFNNKVGIYEISNSGWPYNLGYILGVMLFYGGSTKSGSRKWK